MSKRWIPIVVVGLIAVVGVWLWWSRTEERPETIDLVEAFATAEKRTNLPSLELAFNVEDVTIDEVTKRVIYCVPTSRIIWRLRVPDGAWLRTSIALKPEAWGNDGDGVLFRIGVSDGRTYEELLNQLVDPINVPEDRRWIPVVLDLSGYGGMDVELIFNTNTGLPGTDNSRWDWSIWGEPEIFVE